jgi:hypothetical protein
MVDIDRGSQRPELQKAGWMPASAGEATLVCLACGKQPGPWMARLRYSLNSSSTLCWL